MVNFRPSSNRDFRNRSSGRFGDRGGFRDRGRDRRRPEMHEVTCDKCGKQCEVPFKPTSGKPVYCSECFGKEESGSRSSSNVSNISSGNSGMSTEQFDKLNSKLDKILEFLSKIEFEEIPEDESEEEN